MSTQTFLVIGATGKTGQYTVQHLLERGHAVRAMVHKEDERSEVLRRTGAEVVIGELLEHDDVIRAAAGTSAAYFCYPVSPGLIPATAYFADAAKRAALKVVVNMSQISAREDSKSHAARDHWIAERLFDWSGVPTVHIRPTFFSESLLFPFVVNRCGTSSKTSTCRSAFIQPARPRSGTMRGGGTSGMPISTRSRTRSETRSS